jgi:MFS family permease
MTHCLQWLTRRPSAIFAAAWFQQRYGYRRVIQVGLVAMFCFIFIVFFAQNIVSNLVSGGRISDTP